MTLTLQLLADQYVFESSPSLHDLGALHVPFDELVGNQQTEQRLDEAVRRQEHTALIGSSGCGKSSVVAHVLGPSVAGVAPLRVPVAAMPANAIDTPANLVDHLLATITRQAGASASAATIEEGVAPRTETTTTTRRLGGAVGWRWLSGELAREVERQTEIEQHATFADKTDAVAQVLELIASDDLHPVLVFDDTDRWLRNGGSPLVRAFFGEGVRWLLDLPASLVVAVHDDYFTDIARAELLQYLDTQITIPRVSGPAGIEAILTRRVEQYGTVETPDLGSVFADNTVAALYDVYDETGSLRRTIHVCHTALHDAINVGDEHITARHIVAASSAG